VIARRREPKYANLSRGGPATLYSPQKIGEYVQPWKGFCRPTLSSLGSDSDSLTCGDLAKPETSRVWKLKKWLDAHIYVPETRFRMFRAAGGRFETNPRLAVLELQLYSGFTSMATEFVSTRLALRLIVTNINTECGPLIQRAALRIFSLSFRCCPEGMKFGTVRQLARVAETLPGVIDRVSRQKVHGQSDGKRVFRSLICFTLPLSE
jgi:hypothetical protein